MKESVFIYLRVFLYRLFHYFLMNFNIEGGPKNIILFIRKGSIKIVEHVHTEKITKKYGWNTHRLPDRCQKLICLCIDLDCIRSKYCSRS